MRTDRVTTAIELLRFRREYRYIWRKRVDGFDLSVHCARCLAGPYDPRFSPSVREYRDIRDEAEPGTIFYICSVWNYAENVHIAYRVAEGARLELHTPFVDASITNAEALPISPEWIDRSLPQSRRRPFSTCRNWQFANWLARHGRGSI